MKVARRNSFLVQEMPIKQWLNMLLLFLLLGMIAWISVGAEKGAGQLTLESPRAQLLRKVEHSGLKKLLKFHYRENATVGSGSTADILRHELKTGELYSPSGHMQKAIEGRDRLTRLIKSGILEHQDMSIAKWVRQDLVDALSQERTYSYTMGGHTP